MIGEMLQERREELGISLPEMANKLNTTRQRVEQVEKDITRNPGGIFCLKLSNAYRLPIKKILEGLRD